jgi:alpha-tubulin suppressor-like RCC1 family protein
MEIDQSNVQDHVQEDDMRVQTQNDQTLPILDLSMDQVMVDSIMVNPISDMNLIDSMLDKDLIDALLDMHLTSFDLSLNPNDSMISTIDMALENPIDMAISVDMRMQLTDMRIQSDMMVQPTDMMLSLTDIMVQPTDMMVQPTDMMVQPTDMMVQPTDMMVQPADMMIIDMQIPTCEPGYVLSNQGLGPCIDVNECLVNPNPCGDPIANRCVNEIGSYRCECQNAYVKDMNGLCVDLNECDQPLSSPINPCQQSCQNQVGSYQCACLPGYRLDANQTTCSDIDECMENAPCDQRATCFNFPGSFQCSCQRPGDYGDGFSCQTLKQVGVGINFQCVLTNQLTPNTEAKVYCWGDNTFGQLGDGTNQNRNSPTPSKPVLFGALGNPVWLELGDTFACALLEKNASFQVACWGNNAFGQVGQPAQTLWMNTPSLILKADQTPLSSDFNNLAFISIQDMLKLGSHHACFLPTTQGLSVQCWGNNTKAQLGNGSTNFTHLATEMQTNNQGFQQVLALALGDQHTCLLVSQNQQKEIRCVGETAKIQPSVASNAIGADCLTGIAPNVSSTCLNQPTTPISMPIGITPVDRLTSGLNHLIFQGLNSGSNTLAYYAFGENTKGQLGNNTNQYSFFPVLVSVTWGAKQVDQVIAAGNNGYLLMTDDTLYATGENAQGQLLIQNLTQKLTYTSAQSNLLQFEAGIGRACGLVLENQVPVLKCGGGSHLPDLGIGGCPGGCRFVDYTLKPVIWQ